MFLLSEAKPTTLRLSLDFLNHLELFTTFVRTLDADCLSPHPVDQIDFDRL